MSLDEKDLNFNRKLLLGYFLYTTFSGALRKWVFSGSAAIEGMLLLVQIASPILLTYFMRREKGGLLYFPILPIVLVLAALALNPLSHTLYHSIFGFVLHLGFWLMILIYVKERDSFPIEQLVGAMAITCVVEALLGFMQFGLSPDHVINQYVRDENATKGFGDDMGTRIIGTFSYITGYGAFLVFFGMLVWALMLENKRKLFVIYGLMVLGLVASFMNGSRSVVLPFVMATAFGFLNYGSAGNKIKAVALVACVAMLAVVFNVGEKLPFVEKAYEAFSGRVKHGQSSGESSDRVLLTFDALINYTGHSPAFGIGLGATYQGATSKWGGSHLLPAYEAEQERVIIEGGYFLFIIRVMLLLYLMSQLRIPIYFSAPLLFYIFMFLQIVFNSNQCTYAFFGIMLVDKMYYLREKNALAQSQTGPLET